MEPMTLRVAATLKAMRSLRGWSLADTALHTGVSKAMLGQIERGESSPTVATLWKIASGMNLAFSSFLEPASGEPGESSSPARSAEPRVFVDAGGSMRVETLFDYDAQLGFEMFIIDLAAGGLSHSSPHAAGVVEHVIVISGELNLTVDGSLHRLNAGDSLRFTADCDHSYQNNSDHPVRFHDLIHYPLRQL